MEEKVGRIRFNFYLHFKARYFGMGGASAEISYLKNYLIYKNKHSLEQNDLALTLSHCNYAKLGIRII